MGLFDSFIGQDYSYPSVGYDYPNYTPTLPDSAYAPSLDVQYSMPAGSSVWEDGSNWNWAPDAAAYNYDYGYSGPARGSFDGFIPQGGQYSTTNPLWTDVTSGTYGEVPQEAAPTLLDRLGGWASNNPDKAVAALMGGLNGIGSLMAAKESNKFNKKAYAAMKKRTKNAEKMDDMIVKSAGIQHSWNDSIDPAAQAQKFAYHSLTPEQAMHYGETGAPHQQMVPEQPAAYSPNADRIQLADGGLAEDEPYQPHAFSILPDLGYLGYLLNIGKGGHREDWDTNEPALKRLMGFGSQGVVAKAVRDKQQHEKDALQGKAAGGLSQYSLGGHTGGQDDKIPAMLSDGEYVIDADTVAALGDGNTKAGASALDQMRQEVRRHKRSAPIDRIPPKAKPAVKYLPKKGRK